VPSEGNGTRSVPAIDRQLDGINLLPILTGEQAAASADVLLAGEPFNAPAKSDPPRRLEIHPGWRRRFAIQPERRHRRAARLGYQNQPIVVDLKARLKA